MRNLSDKVGTAAMATAQFAAGAVLLFNMHLQPPSTDESMTGVSSYAWALLMVLSSPVLVAGRFRDWPYLEAAGCFGSSMAYFMYIIALNTTKPLDGLVVTLFLSGFVVAYFFRGLFLSRMAKEAKRGADADDPVS